MKNDGKCILVWLKKFSMMNIRTCEFPLDIRMDIKYDFIWNVLWNHSVKLHKSVSDSRATAMICVYNILLLLLLFTFTELNCYCVIYRWISMFMNRACSFYVYQNVQQTHTRTSCTVRLSLAAFIMENFTFCDAIFPLLFAW